MAHFALLWKARTIEKYRVNYEKEKNNSIVMANVDISQKSLFQRWRHYRYDTQKRLSKTFKNWYPEGSKLSNFLLYLKTDQTFPNFLLKSFLGFFGGVVLTYLCFIFFVFQLSISLIHATIMSSIIGVLLTLGLAFSYRIRCLVFLLIPQFFSRVGRYTLTCYALVLILTGPATNTLKNSEVLSESMACSQEQIKTNVRQINESIKKPFNTIKDSIKLMIERMKQIAMKVNKILLKINKLVLSVGSVIQKGFSWLQSVAIICNHKLGTPYQRCINAVNEGARNCKKIFGDNFSRVCKATYVAQATCEAVKPLKTFCAVADFVNDSFMATIKKKLKNFSERVKTMLFVEVHIHHSYTFSSNASRSASQVAAGIVTEIRKRADPLITWLSWSSCVTSLFLLLIIFRAKYYQHMFETRSRFDNRYITKELRELDLRRSQQGRETVLPLNRRERTKYITTTSFRLVSSEKVFINRSIVFMAITTFKLLIHMVADYSLYWVLMTIRYHGRFQSPLKPGVPDIGLHVSGSGFIAQLLQSIIGVVNIPLGPPIQSPISCLPDPYPPDFRRYTQIGVLIFLLWFFALFEPYGLRIRHIIMGHYRPERAKARAVWLYNHILRTRGGFLKFARRKLHREYKYTTEAAFTFKRWVHSHIPFQWLRSILGTNPVEPHCLLCGTKDYPNDPDTQLIRCETPNCPGTYCLSCFSDIGQLCTICLSPSDYGDLSDGSLEKGSSDESDDGENNDHNPEASTPQNNVGDQSQESDEYDSSPRENRNNLISRTRKETFPDKIPLLRHCSEPMGDCYKIKNVTSSTSFQIFPKKRTQSIKPKNTFFTCLFQTLPELTINCGESGIIVIKIVHNKMHILMLLRKKSIVSIKMIYWQNKIGRRHIKYKLCDTFLQKLGKYSISYNEQSRVPERKTKNNHWRKRRNAGIMPNKYQMTFKNSIPLYCYNISKSKHSVNVTKSLHGTKFAKYMRMKYKKIIRSKKKFREKEAFITQNNNNNTASLQQSIHGLNDCSHQCHHNNNKNESNKQNMISPRENENKKAKPNNNITEYTRNGNIENIYVSNNNHSSDRLGKFHMFFSKHWNNIKFSLIPCSELLKSKKNIPPLKDKRHKFKKKRKKLINEGVKSPKCNKSKKSNDDARNYRISAYLAEQDWIKNKFLKGGSLFEKMTSNHSIKKDTKTIKYKTESSREIPKDIAVGIIKLPAQQWDKYSSQESMVDNLINANMPVHQEVNCIAGKKKDLTKKALERFYNRMSFKLNTSKVLLHSTSRPEDNEVLQKGASKENCITHLTKSEKRMKYFRSLGKNEFENEIKTSGSTLQSRGSGEAKENQIKSNLKKKSSLRHDNVTDEKNCGDRKLAAHSSSVHFEETVKENEVNDSQQDNIDKRASIKRTISDRFLDFGLRKALSIIKDLYASLFANEEDESEGNNKQAPSSMKEELSEVRCRETNKDTKKTANKGVTVLPVTASCACQYVAETPESQDRTTQIQITGLPNDSKCKDAQADSTAPVCTCGTQYRPQNKMDASTVCYKKCGEPSGSENTDSSFGTLNTSADTLTTVSDESKTDTTICSLATMNYGKERKPRGLKFNVITKANQSTLTDRTKVCDVSTTTDDWWSPIVERKNKGNDKMISLKKKTNEKLVKKRAKNKGVTTDGRMVAFRSRTQIIPTVTDDILSPSRYLLESQKYYNELFSSKFYAPHVFTVAHDQKHHEHKVRSPIGSRHHSRRGHKTKRLEESYSPRKPANLRKKNVESTKPTAR